MTKTEREFLNDIKDAVSDWGYSYEASHDTEYDGSRYFNVVITIDDMEECAENSDEIWQALCDVVDEWEGAGIDESSNNYYLSLSID